MGGRGRVYAECLLACIFLSLISWANKYRLSPDRQGVTTRLELGERPLQLRMLLREPSTHILHLASSKRHHGLPSNLHTPGSSKLEISYGTVLSALQNVIQSKDETIHCQTEPIEEEEPAPPPVPAEKIIRDPGQAYLAMCLGVKDQNKDLREWIRYHQSLGVGKFYVFDDSSIVPAAEAIQDLIQEGLVECEAVGPIPENTTKPQLHVYGQCIQRYRARHQWIAFVDADEFFVIRDANVTSLPQLLREYTDYGALAVNWQIFGASGHVTTPQGSTLSSYTACYPEHDLENQHVKSIVNMDFVYQIGRDPHHFKYYEGKQAVNSAGENVYGARASDVVTDKIVLNHYVTKSLEQYQQKMNRGSGMGNRKSIEFFDLTQLMATENCTYAVHL